MTRNKVHKIAAPMSILILMIALLTGCSSSANDETVAGYQEETDFQYMNYDSYNNKCGVQKGKDDYFFVKSGFLYKIDGETMNVHPVCKEKDCKHDRAIDMEHMKACRAYLKDYAKMDKQVQYYDGWIYYEVNEVDKNEYDTTNRWEAIKADGSGEVKTVATVKGNKISKWLIHRGALYYMCLETHISHLDEKDEGVDIGGLIPKLKIYRINFNKKDDNKKKLIYQTQNGFESCEGMDSYKLFAYGNNIYFSDSRSPIDEPDDEDKDVVFSETVIYRYHIISGDKTKVKIPGVAYVSNILKVEDQIVFQLYCYNEDISEAKFEVYQSDVSGHTLKKVQTDEALNNGVTVSDGKYLYVDNYSYLWGVIDNEKMNSRPTKHKVQVYDSKFRKVDSYGYEEDEVMMTIPGDDKYMFRVEGSEWDYKVYVMDKTQIGSIKDKKMKKKKIYHYIGNWGKKS